MSYIGKTPTVGNFQVCDAISVVNNQAAYTMQVGGVNVSPESANHMLVSLNGILQQPNSSFTVSNSVITFASNLVTNDVINFIQILGSVLDLGVPSDNTVTLAKLASGTDGNLISYDTSGNPVAVATGNDGQVLTSTGAGSPPAFETLPVGGITMADQWRLSAAATGLSGASNKISSNWERTDTTGYGTIGSAMSQSSGTFTFPTTGIYLIMYKINGKSTSTGNNRYANGNLYTSTNGGSSVAIAARGASSSSGNLFDFETTAIFIFDVTNTSTHKVQMGYEFEQSTQIYGGTNDSQTCVTFVRLGDT